MKLLIIFFSLLFFNLISSAETQSSERLRSIQQKKTDTIMPQKDAYACKVHSDIIRDKPGKCPKCGRDLVKKGASAAVYTCPHHPQVKQNKAGVCPKCGMDLIKKEDTKKETTKRP